MFIMLINVKMPTTVGILTFMSRINFVLSRVEHGKSFITLEPGVFIYPYLNFRILLMLSTPKVQQFPRETSQNLSL